MLKIRSSKEGLIEFSYKFKLLPKTVEMPVNL